MTSLTSLRWLSVQWAKPVAIYVVAYDKDRSPIGWEYIDLMGAAFTRMDQLMVSPEDIETAHWIKDPDSPFLKATAEALRKLVAETFETLAQLLETR